MREKEISKNIKQAVIYQIFLRSFTREGTLLSAEKMLAGVKDLGADIVYLCPICEADDSENLAFWSERQIQSGMDNPKNPYRIKDYFKIDTEYGTDEDLKNFVDTAHRLGLKVMLDLVYFHCGPNASFLEKNPEFVIRDKNGDFACGEWHFPRLNFESKELREDLLQNMEYFVKEFDIDGYRTDVGDSVPLDFWREGIQRVKKLKSDFIMLNEGTNPQYLKDAFDINYDFQWSYTISEVFSGKKNAGVLTSLWKECKNNSRVLRSFDNHDITNDAYDIRPEQKTGTDGTEAMLVLNFAIDGIPFLYNGVEVCDRGRHSIFANRFYGKNCYVNWENALTENGIRRRAVIKKLCHLKKSIPALYDGGVQWIANSAPERVLSFMRECGSSRVWAVINTSDTFIEADIHDEFYGTPIMARGASFLAKNEKTTAYLMPYGYILLL